MREVRMRLGDDRHLDQASRMHRIGTQVGPFTIVCRLGEGGASEVYLAEHAVLKTRRAVKFLSPRLTQNAQLVRRFVHEARAAARLHHRNLIQVHDVGQLPSGAWFMVLDYLEGQTLGQFIARHGGPLPPHVVLHIVCEIANGLQVAHDHEIVHRELDPDRVVLISREGDPLHAVVLDLGVAQLGDPESDAQGRMATGAPVYRAPEQLRGSAVGPAADIFTLGVIAYQMTTGGSFPYQYGEPPAVHGELAATELYHRQMTGMPVSPRERVPGLGAAWTSALLAAVHPDPARRPDSARAFVLSLAEAVPGIGVAPDGLAIVRTYARELADAGPGLVAPRGSWPVLAAPAPGVGVGDGGSRYQLGPRLGSGGMAEVFAGTMSGVEGFARRVAIKRVLSGLSQIATFAAMFVAEAQIASRLAHPNIVSVLDFSRDPEDRLFLVMEFVDGTDLASLLESGPITPGLAIFIVVELLRALGYAHDLCDPVSGTRGVIHRDVSPQNLLLSYEGAVKVSDFGLAKVRAASDAAPSDTVRGKPSYMSPEQMSGDPLDGRSDLYAVGVMLWEMLAHRPLFAGTAKEIMAQVMFKDIAAPSSFRGHVPADLAAVAMTLVARDRRDRYPTAAAAIEALLCCADVPRDGRGDLVDLLAERFPAAGVRSPRKAAAASPPRAEQVTVSAPPSCAASLPLRGLAAPRRRVFAATVSGVVLGSLAAVVVVARGEVAQSGTRQPVATEAIGAAHASAATTVPDAMPGVAGPAPGGLGRVEVAVAPWGAGVGDAAPVPAGHPVQPGAPRPALPASVHHERARAARTGELAIIVKPWAMIWLNGKARGQTPFRADVPAGRYRVRLVNDDVGQSETTTVTVEPDRTATIERSW